MCGIAGFIAFDQQFNLNDAAKNMASSLRHRGPDSEGIWLEHQYGIGLIHQRLSIIDLSNHGHQPMHSSCGRYILVFNGEIYNHVEIRQNLEKSQLISWRGYSDTETLLCAFQLWGLTKTLNALVGMFAIALWDKKEQKLFLMRDRMGEKPLYYGFAQGSFVFTSELKALKFFPRFKPELNLDALYQYFSFNFIPAPLSIYHGIFKLKPGCFLEIGLHSEIKLHSYWQLKEVAKKAKQSLILDEEEALYKIQTGLGHAVKLQLRADVPMGAFLSGGIDSSLIVSMMQAQSNCPIKTFSIGFNERDYDESRYAEAVAKHLRTEHHSLKISSKDVLDSMSTLAKIYDEPFADSSQISVYLVSKLAREKVKVVLTGDAGDEVFGGYNRYLIVPNLEKKLRYIPGICRRSMASALKLMPTARYDRWNQRLPIKYRFSLLGDKIHKMAHRLGDMNHVDGLYHSFLLNALPAQRVLSAKYPYAPLFSHLECKDDFESLLDRMMLTDSLMYLPNDILTKVDRASMSLGLETRIPYLDHRLLEIAWRLPNDMKVRNYQGKWVLRKILQKHLPQHLIERPKMGFGIPLALWLKTDLKSWVNDVLHPQKLQEHGLLNGPFIQEIWQEHQNGHRDWSSSLWSICMFQAWYTEFF